MNSKRVSIMPINTELLLSLISGRCVGDDLPADCKIVDIRMDPEFDGVIDVKLQSKEFDLVKEDSLIPNFYSNNELLRRMSAPVRSRHEFKVGDDVWCDKSKTRFTIASIEDRYQNPYRAVRSDCSFTFLNGDDLEPYTGQDKTEYIGNGTAQSIDIPTEKTKGVFNECVSDIAGKCAESLDMPFESYTKERLVSGEDTWEGKLITSNRRRYNKAQDYFRGMMS